MTPAATLAPPAPPARALPVAPPEVPDLDPSLDLFAEIERLKRETNAVVLAHYYQEPDIQDVADFVGDSLGLAQEARRTKADTIVFAGVHFMAETAKILNPDRVVLMPDETAGCSLADACPPDAFARFLAAHPGHEVVSYINCTAAVKAMSDVICTSSNAEKIVSRIPADRPIVFAPDKNLGRHVERVTGRKMAMWDGSCIVHEMFSEKRLLQLAALHPEAVIVAHPECEESVLRHARHIASTTGLIAYVAKSPAKEFIVATEVGILHPMRAARPDALLIPCPPGNRCACNECPHMKKNTLEKLYLCMRDRRPELLMDEAVRVRALAPIERMLEWSR